MKISIRHHNIRTLKQYYVLTKPGIVRGNAITAIAGFLLAAQGNVRLSRLLAMVVGLSFVIASGCICNNYIDRGIDRKMARTRQRALASGTIPAKHALLLAVVLGVVGASLLAAYTNLLTAALGVFGFVMYVVVYGVAKRRSVHGTVVGSISGAIPPVVGYTAVTGRLDLAALLLFLIVVFWQMPHFYTIAMFRMEDYRVAGIPVLPLRSGIRATKIQIMLYTVVFILAVACLTIFGYTGWLYLIVGLLLGGVWLWFGLVGFRLHDDPSDIRWARKMFGISLLVLTGLSLAIGVDSFLPWGK